MQSPKFEYIIGIQKKENNIKPVSYNCPYENIEKVKDDINVIIYGKDLKGNDCNEYKTINLEENEDGFYWVKILVRYFPNNDGTYDQIFELQNIEKGEKNINPFSKI